MKESLFMEKATAKVVLGPVDFNTGANTGERIDMRMFKRVTFICALAAGTTPDNHTFTLRQHTAASAGTSADLASDTPYFHKINAATSFTKITPDTAVAAKDLDTLAADNKFMVVFEVLQQELTDGYRWVSVDAADSGGSQLGCVIAICHEAVAKPAYSQVV
jgi:hypothetical protein